MVSADDIAKFVIAAVIISFAVLFISLITGRYLDIKIEKEKYQEYGKAINLLHAIATSSDIVVKDSNNQPMKIILDRQKIIDASTKNEELECCNYYDYNYFLEITDFRTGESWVIGSPSSDLNKFFKNGKKCEVISKDKELAAYSIPITIYNGTNINPGMMKVRLIKTPLSNIAYYSAIACMKENYETTFNVYNLTKDSSGIKVSRNDSNEYEICILTDNNNKMCKIIECNISIEEKYLLTNEYSENDICYPVKIVKENGKVVIYVPQIF